MSDPRSSQSSEAEIRRLRYENAVLANNLHWAKATFGLIGRDDYAAGVDRLQERYGLPAIDDMVFQDSYLVIRRGPTDA